MKKFLLNNLLFQLHEGAAYQPRKVLRLLVNLLFAGIVVVLGWRKVPENMFYQPAFYWQFAVFALTIAIAYEINLRLHYLMLYRRLYRKDKDDGMLYIIPQLLIAFTLYVLLYIVGSFMYEAAPAPRWDFVPFKVSLDYLVWPILALVLATLIAEVIANERWAANLQKEEEAETEANLNPGLDVDSILNQARESQRDVAFSFLRSDDDDDEWKLYLDKQDRQDKLDNLCAYAEAPFYSIYSQLDMPDDRQAFMHMTGEPLECIFSWANDCLLDGHLYYRKTGLKGAETFEVSYGNTALHMDVTGRLPLDLNQAIYLLAEVTGGDPQLYWLRAIPRSDFNRFAYLNNNERQELEHRLGIERFKAYFLPVTSRTKIYTQWGEWMYRFRFFTDLPKHRLGIPFWTDEE